MKYRSINKEEFKAKYCARLRELREERNLTYVQVSEIIGKSEQFYRNIEMGKTEMKVPEAIKLCDLYGVTVDDLLGIHSALGK